MRNKDWQHDTSGMACGKAMPSGILSWNPMQSKNSFFHPHALGVYIGGSLETLSK